MKLTKAQKKKQNSKHFGLNRHRNKEKESFNPVNIIKDNYKFLLLVSGITFLVFFNSLNNQFSVIDDLPTIVNNESIQNFQSSLKTLHLQTIIYASLYTIGGGLNVILFNLSSLFAHILVVVLVFPVLFYLFGKRVALIATLLFAIHPIVTEPVNWISGTTYIYNALFAFASILFFIGYKLTEQMKYFVFLVITYSLYLLTNYSPWVLVIPLALVVIDQFFYNDKINFKTLKPIAILIIPIIIFATQPLQTGLETRLSYRGDNGGRSLQNQQSLKPVVESYPYTVYSLTRLYLTPVTLTVYHDGAPITTPIYMLMFITFFVYSGVIYYFWERNRKVAGMLILLLVLIAPTFSPKKITWFIAERYLYLGTAIFTSLVAMFFIFLEDRFNKKHLALYLSLILLILYSTRTIIRNNDWDTPETLALATINTSPLSVRPYNDLAGYYVMNNRTEEAREYYQKALEVEPLSSTAINNLGYIYINEGLPERNMDYNPAYINSQEFRNNYNLAKEHIANKQDQKALYYLSKAIEYDPGSVGSSYLAGQIFSRAGNTKLARDEFNRVFSTNPDHTESLFEMGFIEYQEGNLEKAKEYLNQALSINPTHTGAINGLEYISKIESGEINANQFDN